MLSTYCEHVAGALTQPLNTVTNAAFFIAALAGWRLQRRVHRGGTVAGVLIAILAAIGIGSTLFHAMPTPITLLADVLPILFFQLVYVPAYAVQVMRSGPGRAALLLLLYLLLVGACEQLPADTLNGSAGYLPALACLSGLGLWHALTRQPARWHLLLAAGVFLLSLTARTLDAALCASIPSGLHFIWHLLNGLVLYLALAAFIKAAPPKSL